ncbi:MAG: hypothetical protein M0014_05755 [Actinomycetota bacterium]|jgi:hypothetical protein|nr:hypothetical protein [Actinomycetota bacterium]
MVNAGKLAGPTLSLAATLAMTLLEAPSGASPEIVPVPSDVVALDALSEVTCVDGVALPADAVLATSAPTMAASRPGLVG